MEIPTENTDFFGKTSMNVAIAAAGMVTSLGLDVATSCAAARAGITRANSLGVLKVRNPEDGELQDVVGHAVEGIKGFEGEGRLLALASAALRDLFRSYDKSSVKWKRCGIFLGWPNPMRTSKGIELIQNEELKKAKREAKEATPAVVSDEIPVVGGTLAEKVIGLAGIPSEPGSCAIFYGEHQAFVKAVQSAVSALESGTIDEAIVGAVDSLIDNEVLIWLYQTGRLKCGEMPVGLQPGEAAVFCSLRRPSSLRTQVGDRLPHIVHVNNSAQATSLLDGHPADGTGLSQLLAGLCNASTEFGERVWILTDHNGEPYRAYDWGLAQTRVAASHPTILNQRNANPAISFGDTGAACGAVATCVAMSAFKRKYAPAPMAWIVTSSSDGYHGALALISN